LANSGRIAGHNLAKRLEKTKSGLRQVFFDETGMASFNYSHGTIRSIVCNPALDFMFAKTDFRKMHKDDK